MTPHRSILAGGLLIALQVGLLEPALAGECYDVILANRLVARLRDPGGYGSVSARGSAVEKNVVEALSVEDVGHPRMWTGAVGGLPAVYIGRTFLVQVRRGDAAARDVSTSGLAREWLLAFRQQFPRAQPVTKMGSSGGGRAVSAGGSGPAPAPVAPVVVPPEDKALVEEVERLLTDSRALGEADAQTKCGTIAAEAATSIWRASPDAAADQELSTIPGSANAIQSALNGVRFAREASDQAFAQQKDLIAVTIVKRVRAALQASG